MVQLIEQKAFSKSIVIPDSLVKDAMIMLYQLLKARDVDMDELCQITGKIMSFRVIY